MDNPAEDQITALCKRAELKSKKTTDMTDQNTQKYSANYTTPPHVGQLIHSESSSVSEGCAYFTWNWFGIKAVRALRHATFAFSLPFLFYLTGETLARVGACITLHSCLGAATLKIKALI